MGRRRAIAFMVIAVALAACTPQELGEFLSATDVRSSEKPVEAGAGNAAEMIELDNAAQELADEGLREKSRDKLDKAVDKRPWDARYSAYRVALAIANGDVATTREDVVASYRAYLEAHTRDTTKSSTELYSEWLLVFLGALDRALDIEHERTPADADRIQRLQTSFCDNLAYYNEVNTGVRVDVLSVMFLEGADCSGR